jgi:uncharacterized protein (TIGR00369 family)
MQARIQALVDRSPYNTWLGLRVIRADEESVEIEAAWREEFISAPERQAVHGGVLAALVDSGAVFAVIARTGQLAATVDLRADYHAIPASAAMRLVGRVIHQGKRISTAEAQVLDHHGRLVASGRATVLSLQPK